MTIPDKHPNLDDRAVQALSDAGAMCGNCGDEPGDRTCPDCEKCRTRYVAALRAVGWGPQDDALVAEVRRFRDELAEMTKRARERGELAARREAELLALRPRVAELERPAVEAKRNEIRQSFTEIAAQCEQDGDYEAAANFQRRLREREEQWKREDAARPVTPA
jgi:hypothetical protein